MVDMQIGMRMPQNNNNNNKKKNRGQWRDNICPQFDDIIDQIDSISINIHKLNSLWVKTYIKTFSNSRSAQNSVSSGNRQQLKKNLRTLEKSHSRTQHKEKRRRCQSFSIPSLVTERYSPHQFSNGSRTTRRFEA